MGEVALRPQHFRPGRTRGEGVVNLIDNRRGCSGAFTEGDHEPQRVEGVHNIGGNKPVDGVAVICRSASFGSIDRDQVSTVVFLERHSHDRCSLEPFCELSMECTARSRLSERFACLDEQRALLGARAPQRHKRAGARTYRSADAIFER